MGSIDRDYYRYIMRWNKYIVIWLLVWLVAPVGMACPTGDDDDKDPVVQRDVRRLHPERERAKAMKKLQEQLSRKAEPKADPWDTTGELWGTVDVVRGEAIDSTAVAGRRVKPGQQHTSKTPEEQAALDALLAEDYSLADIGRRMRWRDVPVTATIDQLMPGFAVSASGDCVSKYVTWERGSNEVFFSFANNPDGTPGPLRLCLLYCADDPLGLDQVIFTIDGFDYTFYPSQVEQGKVSEDVYWEAFDQVLKNDDRDLVYALAHCHWGVMKLHSSRGIHHVKMLTEGQRTDFTNTLDLYRLLGGVCF